MPQTFNHAVITNDGAALLNRAQAGEVKIEFTRIVVGNGIYADSEKELSVLQERTALKNQKNSYALSDIEVYTDRSVKVTALITNYDSVSNQTLVNQGYYINEMGLYARSSGSSEGTDILYSIAVISSETGDFMPPYNGYNPAEIIQEYYATVSSSANVTIQRNMGAPALADDLQDTNVRVDSLEKSRVWFWNCGSSKTDTEKSVDVEGFQLFSGVRIVIRFQWGNAAENITLNVNGTGAAPVRYRGTAIPADYIRAGHFVELVYYDNCWNVVGDLTQAQVEDLKTRLAGLTPADIGALSSSGNAVSASKWNTARKINGMSVDGTTDRMNYGVCSTSGSTTAKTVSCTGFSLITGAEITVKFNNTNTASNPTLNVNSTGAKAIYYKGKAVPSGYILSGGTYTFRYNGTQWELVGDVAQKQVDSLKSEITELQSCIRILKDFCLQKEVYEIGFSTEYGKLWAHAGADNVFQEGCTEPGAKCAAVNVMPGVKYAVITSFPLKFNGNNGYEDIPAIMEVSGGNGVNYGFDGNKVEGTGKKDMFEFETGQSTTYLMINCCDPDVEIRVYRIGSWRD